MEKLYKSRTNKRIAGVCGGLGDYFRIDPTLIRLIIIFICFFTAGLPVLVAYFIVVLIVPYEPMQRLPKKVRRLYRSKKNKVIAGVCGGISEFFKIDVIILRIIFIFITIITGILPMFITYIIAWIIIPEKS